MSEETEKTEKTNEAEKASKLEYHLGFYAAIHVAYWHVHAEFEFPHELEIGVKPLRLDMLLIRRRNRRKLLDAIGRFLRKLNVLEYKSPGDSLHIDDVFKTQAYACLCKALRKWGRFAGDELTSPSSATDIQGRRLPP